MLIKVLVFEIMELKCEWSPQDLQVLLSEQKNPDNFIKVRKCGRTDVIIKSKPSTFIKLQPVLLIPKFPQALRCLRIKVGQLSYYFQFHTSFHQPLVLRTFVVIYVFYAKHRSFWIQTSQGSNSVSCDLFTEQTAKLQNISNYGTFGRYVNCLHALSHCSNPEVRIRQK